MRLPASRQKPVQLGSSNAQARANPRCDQLARADQLGGGASPPSEQRIQLPQAEQLGALSGLPHALSRRLAFDRLSENLPQKFWSPVATA
jgi:hypothetical protein